MKQESKEKLRILIADVGMYLIHKSMNPDSICEMVYLGVNDDAKNWEEVTAEFAELLKAQQENEYRSNLEVE